MLGRYMLSADDLGRTFNKALETYDLPNNFGQYSTLAADHRAWHQRIGVRPPCPRPATTLIHDKWRGLFDGFIKFLNLFLKIRRLLLG